MDPADSGETPQSGIRWRTPLVWESELCSWVEPDRLDALLNRGWRHFGRQFYRYSYWLDENGLKSVQPVRVDLGSFRLSKSQRRVLRRNADLEISIAPPVMDAERHGLFHRHKARFTNNVPESLHNFLGERIEDYPCPMLEVVARHAGRLVAASYMDVGTTTVSSVYAFFDPDESTRSLGIATLLWEMGWAIDNGRRHHHSGYAFHEPSMMDYKKRFAGTEWFDWEGRWHPLGGEPSMTP